MIPKRLQSRLKFIEATPLKNRAKTSIFSRRGENHVIMDEEDYELEKYDTFFDYEEDLADLKPSGEQYMEMINPDPYITLEEKDEVEEESFGSIVMEETILSEPIEMEEVKDLALNHQENNTYTDVVGFEFIQCDFVKTDGNRCKRQAPNGNTICSTHRRYIEKHDAK